METMTQEETINRLKAAWARVPGLRFGQFIQNITMYSAAYYGSDETLVEKAEAYVNEYAQEKESQ